MMEAAVNDQSMASACAPVDVLEATIPTNQDAPSLPTNPESVEEMKTREPVTIITTSSAAPKSKKKG